MSENQAKEGKRRSILEKTKFSIVKTSVILGIMALFVSLTFYAMSLTKQYIRVADGTAKQTKMSIIHTTDIVNFSKQVMDIYNSLSEEEKLMNGTDEYHKFFSKVDKRQGGTYDYMVHLLDSICKYHDIYDVYIAMYDPENNRIVYIVDSDDVPTERLYPGEWEDVNHEGLIRFLSGGKSTILTDIELTEKYGLLCTVAEPIEDDDGNTCAFVLVDISIHDIVTGMAEFSFRLILVIIAVTILISLLQTKRMREDLVEPIKKIERASANYVKSRHDGASNNELFSALEIHTGDEIEDLSKTMIQMEKEISEYEENLKGITAEKERIVTELSLATKIQASMLPSTFPPFPDRHEIDIFAMMDPAREVGGDYYDFFFIDDDHLCVLIADVSGKGIPAALFMMIAKVIMQSCAMLGRSAAEIMEKTNEALCTNNKLGMFVTSWLGILEISTGKMTCANAGHEYPAIMRKGGKFELFKDKHGFVIGGLEESKYKEYELELFPGDKIFLYTDGVPEAENSEQEMYGTGRMVDALNLEPSASPTKVLENVRSDIDKFVNDAEQFDDLTMLCMEYRGK
jgi:sigma-B regulation protein RsbU (phosphoserine phosphatase)